jgi:hypothetical protein
MGLRTAFGVIALRVWRGEKILLPGSGAFPSASVGD